MADVTTGQVFAVIDEYGIDPLLDRSIDVIKSVVNYSYHTVTSDEEHNGPLLAYNTTSDENNMRCILIYNDIVDMFQLKAGMRVKIPSMAELSPKLVDALYVKNEVITQGI